VLGRGNSHPSVRRHGALDGATLLSVKNKTHSVTATVPAPEHGAEDVMIAKGDAFGGWALYARDGKPMYCYNLLGLR
jgi:hypothetical protein